MDLSPSLPSPREERLEDLLVPRVHRGQADAIHAAPRALLGAHDLAVEITRVVAEARRLKRFEALAASPDSAGRDDLEAVLTGWREWWRQGRADDLLAMGARLPAALVQEDRRLASYLVAAREVSRAR